MAFLASSFGTTYYRSAGNSGGFPIVFCNSLGTDARIWDAIVEELSPDYRLISYDKRGHGLTSVPVAPYTIANFADDLLGLLDQLGIERCALVGVSVGGLIAQRFALDHPERLAALVLCDTATKIGNEASWNARIKAVRARGMEAIADAVLLRWFPFSIRTGREVEIEGWRNLLLRCPVEGYSGTCAALREADLTTEVGRIIVPSLVVVGSDDEATPVDLVRSTADRISGARFVVIENAGHLPSIDQPEVLSGLIREHMKAHAHG